MEGGESLLEAIYEEETLEDLDDEDVDMIDAETLDSDCGEQITILESKNDNGGGDDQLKNSEFRTSRSRKRKGKRKRKSIRPVLNIKKPDKFILDTCRHLKEKKLHLVRSAVDCLGVSAVKDLIKEVDAIQHCGGQLTADGKRFRTSGGILFNILKVREPKVYSEIMARGREFEKQCRRKDTKQVAKTSEEAIPPTVSHSSSGIANQVSSTSQLMLEVKPELTQCKTHGERVSVLNRIRVPVTYDDELVGEDAKDDSA
ncbi:phosphorylated adapter RNA export-like protein [Tasmannia lanceolata]|uniref:phosphorylated adapter RNA export-like protein n=1 Tax=Tasmannia lanceolata TaxID=3420 RepID=UPI004063E4D0